MEDTQQKELLMSMSKEIFDYYKKLERLLDDLNLKILYQIYELGPSNLLTIARHLGENPKKVYYRFKILKEFCNIKIRILPSYSSIGLVNNILVIKIKADKIPLLEDILTSLKVPVKTYRVYSNGVYIIVQTLIPLNKKFPIESIIDIFKGDFLEYELERYTDFYIPRMNFQALKLAYTTCRFNVKEFIKLFESGKRFIPPLSPSSKVQLDRVDLELLSKLSKDATTPFSKIARDIGMSPAGVKYHFDRHILNRNMIRGYHIYFPKYPPDTSAIIFIKVKFSTKEVAERFLYALSRSLCTRSFAVSKEDPRKILTLLEFSGGDMQSFLRFVADIYMKGNIIKYNFYLVDLDHIYVRFLNPKLYDKKKGWLIPEDLGLSESLKELGLTS